MFRTNASFISAPQIYFTAASFDFLRVENRCFLFPTHKSLPCVWSWRKLIPNLSWPITWRRAEKTKRPTELEPNSCTPRELYRPSSIETLSSFCAALLWTPLTISLRTCRALFSPYRRSLGSFWHALGSPYRQFVFSRLVLDTPQVVLFAFRFSIGGPGCIVDNPSGNPFSFLGVIWTTLTVDLFLLSAMRCTSLASR